MTALLPLSWLLVQGSGSSEWRAQGSLDTLLVDARLLDGSGNPWRHAHVGIQGERITWIGQPGDPLPAAGRIIELEGRILTPGFIDLHTHTTGALEEAELATCKNFLFQGVTTVVAGNDGRSPWPVGEALSRYRARGIGPNVALLVGHGTVRRQVLGMEERDPTSGELDRMRRLVARGMREGAFGLSTGLFYAPGSYASTREVIALAAEAAAHGGYYDSHIRDESDYSIGLLEAVEEVIRIGREARLPVHIAHIKALGPSQWGQSAAVIERVAVARRAGIDVTADQYPYTASSTSLAGALVPRWAQVGGEAALQARLENREQRARMAEGIRENIRRRGGADRLVVATQGNPSLEGLSLLSIAQGWSVTPTDAALKLLELGGAGLISHNMRDRDLHAFMRQEWVATASDGTTTVFGSGRPHPRGYGTFPRKIIKYALQDGVITMPFAIRAATSLPASIAGIQRRGWVREGYYADLAAFDPGQLHDRATFEDPHQYSDGIDWLFINGQGVIEEGRFTGRLAGRALLGGRQ